MIGPGEGETGGITALVKTLVPVLKKHVDLQYLPNVRGRRPHKRTGDISLQNIGLALSQYARFLCLLSRFRPQIIHLHTSQGLGWLKDTFYILVARSSGCRIVLHIHGGLFNRQLSESALPWRTYTRKVILLTDVVVVVSETSRMRLQHIIPIDRLVTYRNCIATDEFLPNVSRLAINGLKALFLGHVGQSKGVFDLLEAMAYLKTRGHSIQLLIAGSEEREGDMARVLRQLEELNLQDYCQLLGPVAGARKAQLLNESNMLVLPSYQEGLPLAVLEAMAAGLAIVATSVGGIPEVVRDGHNGFLVVPGVTESLAEKLAVLADNHELCQEMGRRSREIAVQELDVEPYAKRLAILYESLAG